MCVSHSGDSQTYDLLCSRCDGMCSTVVGVDARTSAEWMSGPFQWHFSLPMDAVEPRAASPNTLQNSKVTYFYCTQMIPSWVHRMQHAVIALASPHPNAKHAHTRYICLLHFDWSSLQLRRPYIGNSLHAQSNNGRVKTLSKHAQMCRWE